MVSLLRALIWFVALLILEVHAQQDSLKVDAVQRVVGAHDPAIFVATGVLFLKQEAIRAAKGRALSPLTQARIDELIRANVQDVDWFVMGWRTVVDRYFSSEEADEIASHFNTEGGRLQRRVIELAVGEVLMSNYTFTDRIDYRLPGTEAELKELQRVVDERQFKGIQDFSGYPEAVKFASTGVGVSYMKTVMIQGVEAITTHFDAVAKQIREIVSAASRQSE